MGDISDMQSRINMLKFQLSVMGMGANSQQGEEIRQQIADLQKQLMLQKMQEGSS